MPGFSDGFLNLPQRPGKPRAEGLTHVIDKGLNLRDIEGLFDTAGLYRPTGEMRTGLIDEIAHEVDVQELIFEAPTKESQAWFVKEFGPNVNLGNIPPDEVIPLETLRLGLRGDTLKEVLLGGDRAPAP